MIEILNEVCTNLKIVCDRKVNDDAVLNVFHAKLMQVMSFKGVTFESIQNIGNPAPLAYYAFNFVPSGGTKNRLLKEIDINLLEFFDFYLRDFNLKRYNELEGMQALALSSINDKMELRQKKREFDQELANFKSLHKNLSNATQAKIYNALMIIKKEDEGSIFVANTEFANFFEDAVVGRDSVKKEFLNMLYDLYDGEFNCTDTVTTDRDSINGISASCILMSDYQLLADSDRLVNAFKSYLSRGMARRSFVFFDNNSNFFADEIEYPSFDEKEIAVNQLREYGKDLKNIFDKIPKNQKYMFNLKSNERINNYKIEVDKRISKFYKHTRILDKDTEILKLNLEHSIWKILKLAVLYHLLKSPTTFLIDVDVLEVAIEFFDRMHKNLEKMLRSKTMTDYDILYNFLIKNINKFVPKMKIRSQNFVKSSFFKNWIEDAIGACQQMAEKEGLVLVSCATGKRNQGIDFAVYDPKKYEFRAEFSGSIQKGELVCLDKSIFDVDTL